MSSNSPEDSAALKKSQSKEEEENEKIGETNSQQQKASPSKPIKVIRPIPQKVTLNSSDAAAASNPNNQKSKSKEEEEEEKKIGEANPQQQEQQARVSKATQDIRGVAQKICSHPLKNFHPAVWAVLTAVSVSARKRPQGVNILLNADEHCFGRVAEDPCFQIEGTSISANHCKIYRKKAEDAELTSTSISFFLKDTSTNGTFLNWDRLRKESPEAKIKHGDIISFVFPPHNQSSLVFVFREVNKSMCGPALKRKSEEFNFDSKRLKGLGIGSAEGPISLDDVRSLQRSNTELRKELESHVHIIETLRSENRAAVLRYENELKELKVSISHSYLDQLKKLHLILEVKQKELVQASAICSERLHAMDDLKERLSASIQSRVDADEIINSQKATISELEVRLDEERNQRKEEREKAAADLKAALQRAHSEAQEEIKRQADAALKQQREQQEIISKLQESDKESRVLVETLRSKLEYTRESFVISEKRVRQLESQLQEEQLTAANGRKKAETMESEVNRLRKELESEKVAREEAWAKVSALELEIAAAIRDLAIEKQRYQGARERIILRETQLRAFYSTTDEISALFIKQQEQLKAMRRTLEDEENYENTSVDIDLHVDLNAIQENFNGVLGREREDHQRNIIAREGSGTSTSKARTVGGDASDDASATEKHDCDLGTQEGGCTQDAEYTSADPSVKGFGSYIGTEPVPDGDPIDTERVLGTESEAVDIGFSQHVVLHKCRNPHADKMQLDDETQENGELPRRTDDEDDHCSQPKIQLEALNAMEDTEPGTIKTADLLASEVAGSWAVSTAPSVHGENESPSGAHADANIDDETPATGFSDGEAAASQSAPVVTATRLSQERQALNAMIQIVAPEFKEQFQNGGGDECMSDVDTQEGSSGGNDEEDGDAATGKDKSEAVSDSDSKDGGRDPSSDDDNEDGDYEDRTQQDSVG